MAFGHRQLPVEVYGSFEAEIELVCFWCTNDPEIWLQGMMDNHLYDVIRDELVVTASLVCQRPRRRRCLEYW